MVKNRVFQIFVLLICIHPNFIRSTRINQFNHYMIHLIVNFIYYILLQLLSVALSALSDSIIRLSLMLATVLANSLNNANKSKTLLSKYSLICFNSFDSDLSFSSRPFYSYKVIVKVHRIE